MSRIPDINDNGLWITETSQVTCDKSTHNNQIVDTGMGNHSCTCKLSVSPSQFFYRNPEQYETGDEHNKRLHHLVSSLKTQAGQVCKLKESAES